MSSVYLLLLTLLILGMLLGALRSSLRRRARIQTLIFGLTLSHELLLVLLPIWHSVLTDFELESQMWGHIGPSDLIPVMVGEALFVGLFLLGFFLGSPRSRNRPVTTLEALNKEEMIVLTVLTVIGLWVAVETLGGTVASVLESTEHAEIKPYESVAVLARVWVIAAFQIPSIFAASILAAAPKVSKWRRIVGVAVLGSVGLLGIATGARGRITWVLISMTATSLLYRVRKPLLIAGACLVALTPFFIVLGDMAYRFEINLRLRGEPISETVPYVLDRIVETPFGASPFILWEQLMFRAMGPRNSVVLYRLFDAGHGAGGRPIMSSAVMVVPRVLWGTKSPAGSADSSPYGGAMYRVMAIGHGSPYYVMGPFLASAHAYWEGGWVWLLAAGFLTGLVWRFIVRYSERQLLGFSVLYVMIFASSFLLDGFYTALAPLYGLIRAFWMLLCPVLLLRVILFAIVSRRGTPVTQRVTGQVTATDRLTRGLGFGR